MQVNANLESLVEERRSAERILFQIEHFLKGIDLDTSVTPGE